MPNKQLRYRDIHIASFGSVIAAERVHAMKKSGYVKCKSVGFVSNSRLFVFPSSTLQLSPLRLLKEGMNGEFYETGLMLCRA